MLDYLKKRNHKEGVNKDDWDKVHPNLLILAFDFCKWCDQQKLPINFSSIIRGRVKTSKTDIHSQGRAFDVSIRGWATENIDDCIFYINRMWSDTIGAVSLTDKKQRAIVAHGEGSMYHCHLQVKP